MLPSRYAIVGSLVCGPSTCSAAAAVASLVVEAGMRGSSAAREYRTVSVAGSTTRMEPS